MNRSPFLTSVFVASLAGASLLAGSSPASASPDGDGAGDSAGKYADKAAELRRKADELRAAGRADDADRLEKEAKAVEEKAAVAKVDETKRLELKARIDVLKEKAAQARADGRTDDADAASREIDDLLRSPKVVKPESEAALPGDDDVGLARKLGDLREKARSLREGGNAAGADDLEDRAARIDRALVLRRTSAEMKQQAKDARLGGRTEEARELMESSARLTGESDELIAGLSATDPKGPALDPRSAASQAAATAAARIAALRTAARDLRESGKTDEAAKMEDRAAALERDEAKRPDAGTARAAEFAEQKATYERALEKAQRRIAELEEEVRRLKQAK